VFINEPYFESFECSFTHGDGLFYPVQLWRDKGKFLETLFKHVTKVRNNSSSRGRFWHTTVE